MRAREEQISGFVDMARGQHGGKGIVVRIRMTGNKRFQFESLLRG